jgi:hypothetical protein
MCLQTARVGNPAAERALAKPAQLPSRFVITRDRPLATSTVRVAGPSEKAVKKGAATAAKNWAGIDQQALCIVRGAIP